MSFLCVGLASGVGAGNKGCKDGPIFLQKYLQSIPLEWKKLIVSSDVIKNPYEEIEKLNTKFAKEVQAIASDKNFFISFGGDHSSAIGTWSGVSEAYRASGDIGLIWIDAHMDLHTPYTSESGNIHGMPLASLLGQGDPRFTKLLSENPKIKPENVILIGIRSYEKGERDLLEKLGLTVYYMDEVHQKGFYPILKDAILTLQSKTVGYGISFDLDVIDPKFVNAVGTPVENGLCPKEAIKAFSSLIQDHPPLAFELVEYNPSLDIEKKTFQFIENLFKELSHALMSCL